MKIILYLLHPTAAYQPLSKEKQVGHECLTCCFSPRWTNERQLFTWHHQCGSLTAEISTAFSQLTCSRLWQTCSQFTLSFSHTLDTAATSQTHSYVNMHRFWHGSMDGIHRRAVSQNFSPDIYGLQRVNHCVLGEPLTVETPTGQKFCTSN